MYITKYYAVLFLLVRICNILYVYFTIILNIYRIIGNGTFGTVIRGIWKKPESLNVICEHDMLLSSLPIPPNAYRMSTNKLLQAQVQAQGQGQPPNTSRSNSLASSPDTHTHTDHLERESSMSIRHNTHTSSTSVEVYNPDHVEVAIKVCYNIYIHILLLYTISTLTYILQLIRSGGS